MTVSSVTPAPAGRWPLPAAAGVGLRQGHVPDFLAERQKVAWLEVHSENYLVSGGPRLAELESIACDYPLSFHGVGLSLGSAEGLDEAHLARLRQAYDRFAPALVSEHIAWSVVDGVYLNDLLPLPYSEEALEVVCRNVDRAQEAFGRRILVENPSTYLAIAESVIPENAFLAEVVRRTGCGLLLDVNNLYVSAVNHERDLSECFKGLPLQAVGEVHLAGHARRTDAQGTLLVDDHGSRVCSEVWELYERLLELSGPRPTLIEWDTALPPLPVLLGEADGAARRLAASGAASHAA
ncbi:MNIO family bufferin maturase [Fodinicurvata fenggangensis]|uniref:MNIO family bufferin maturase n=1 Tax=Fodinicurvata fenggangensis TaxID=1121830 RepID=UPI00069232E2|nr:DUF692 domain-containing protein [Fodinicurvata fenggangensis]